MIIEARAKENQPRKSKGSSAEGRGLKLLFSILDLRRSTLDLRSSTFVSISGCDAFCPSAEHAVLCCGVRKIAPRASREATHQRSCLLLNGRCPERCKCLSIPG